jgi:hypothetical protein
MEFSVKGNFGTVDWSEKKSSEMDFSVFLLPFLPPFLLVAACEVI